MWRREDMSDEAVLLREQLVQAPGVAEEAAGIATEVANHVVELLNNHGITIAANLLSQALIARALTEIGARWWSADFGGHSIEDTRAALLSIQIEPPSFIRGSIHDIRESDG